MALDARGPSSATPTRRPKPELLAPAGGFEQLMAAIRFGADAVYLASERFGMRSRAANFPLGSIPDAVAVAHRAGVNVYVACNILMGPDDMDQLPDYFQTLDAAGVDGLIIGDLGAFAVARQYAPHVRLHVSTQASVANAEAATVWYQLGARRIVCAREMSLDDIRRMRQEIPDDLELEAFVHGAMCMAVSGRCLISSYLTGRSGNRGHCTQPCRWSYTLEEEKRPGEHFPIEEDDRGTFIMNAKDLNMLAYLDQLHDAGIDSIKIEGRNKKAFYVATVVSAYRRVLDGEPVSQVADELLSISHRPYSTGFYFGEGQQASQYDGYEQETMHVADVISCTLADRSIVADGQGLVDGSMDSDGQSYWLEVLCRNRFSEQDQLEVLEPFQPIHRVVVHDLNWLPDAEEGEQPLPLQPVPVANRTCNRYRFLIGRLVQPGSFLRIRQHRRSARHDGKAGGNQ